jgi:hypothetical protein
MVADCLGFRGWLGQSGQVAYRALSELPPIPAPVRRKNASGFSAMLKALLESRPKLKLHLQTEELPVYPLKVTQRSGGRPPAIRMKRHNTGLSVCALFREAWRLWALGKSLVFALTSDSAAGHRHFRGIHRRHDSLWAELH